MKNYKIKNYLNLLHELSKVDVIYGKEPPKISNETRIKNRKKRKKRRNANKK